jgi:hypothetical protein
MPNIDTATLIIHLFAARCAPRSAVIPAASQIHGALTRASHLHPHGPMNRPPTHFSDEPGDEPTILGRLGTATQDQRDTWPGRDRLDAPRAAKALSLQGQSTHFSIKAPTGTFLATCPKAPPVQGPDPGFLPPKGYRKLPSPFRHRHLPTRPREHARRPREAQAPHRRGFQGSSPSRPRSSHLPGFEASSPRGLKPLSLPGSKPLPLLGSKPLTLQARGLAPCRVKVPTPKQRTGSEIAPAGCRLKSLPRRGALGRLPGRVPSGKLRPEGAWG